MFKTKERYRVSNANEIKTLRDELYRLHTNYERVLDENWDIMQKRNSLLAGGQELKEEMKGFREIESHLSYVEMDIEELENRLNRNHIIKEKNHLIELELSSEVMKLLDEMAHGLPEAFTTRDKRYAACIEKLVLVLRNRNGDKK
jgi:hypothetical protein